MKQKTGRMLLSLLLTLAMVIGLMPGLSLRAYAYDGNPYASLVNQTTDVTFDGKKWYIIEDNSTAKDAGTVTLLAKDCVCSSQYNGSGSFVEYSSNPTVKTAVDNWYSTNITADAKTAVSGSGMFLLTREQANAITNADVRKCSDAENGLIWWLCSRGNWDGIASVVNGGTGNVAVNGANVTEQWGVRPALKLDLSSVIFESDTNTFSLKPAGYNVTVTAGSNMTKTADSGEASQTGLSGAMTDVVYTADEGYYFPEDYSALSVNGISVTRDSYTQITVSGTPTADTEITLTAPTAKAKPGAPAVGSEDCTTADNNDGKLTGVTAEMEYKKSDEDDWMPGTGSDITDLAPGTYYVRVKATDTTLASDNQELTIKGFISYTVTFKVVNGSWDEGEGNAATADKAVPLTGHDGDTLKLAANQIPTAGTRPDDGYTAGSWDVAPDTETAVTKDTTYIYSYEAISQGDDNEEPSGKIVGPFTKYQAFDVQRDPAYPGGTQDNPSSIIIKRLKKPCKVTASGGYQSFEPAENSYFYLKYLCKVSSDPAYSSWKNKWVNSGGDGDLDPFIFELHYCVDGTDTTLGEGIAGAVGEEGFLFELKNMAGWFFSSNKYTYDESIKITYTPIKNGRVICDLEVLDDIQTGGEVEHQHTFGKNPRWLWRFIDGKAYAEAAYTCTCGETETVSASEIKSTESSSEIIYTAEDKYGNEDSRSFTKTFTVTYDGNDAEYAYGATCRLTAEEASDWTVTPAAGGSGVVRAEGTKTFYFPVTESVTVEAKKSTEAQEQTAKIDVLSCQAGQNQFTYKVFWSLPEGAQVKSTMIYRCRDDNAQINSAEGLLGAPNLRSYNMKLNVRNGEFNYTAAGLTSGSKQTVMAQVVYTLKGTESIIHTKPVNIAIE